MRESTRSEMGRKMRGRRDLQSSTEGPRRFLEREREKKSDV